MHICHGDKCKTLVLGTHMQLWKQVTHSILIYEWCIYCCNGDKCRMHCAVIEMHLPKRQEEKISDLLGHQSKKKSSYSRVSRFVSGRHARAVVLSFASFQCRKMCFLLLLFFGGGVQLVFVEGKKRAFCWSSFCSWKVGVWGALLGFVEGRCFALVVFV